MKIGLYNLEPHVVNTAMMQVSTYHKNKGDLVEIYNPFFHDSYEKIYAFSIFDFTDKGYIRSDMICGGTGFDNKDKLPKEIENCDYDWDIFPNCDYSILRFSRGCIRKCGFCKVPEREGLIYPVDHKNLNPKGKLIHVYDNNFFASPKWREAIAFLKSTNQRIVFNQGIDLRIFNDEMGVALQSLKLKYVYFAWDNPKDNLINKIKLLKKYVKAYKIGSYVLIGYDSSHEENLFRVETIKSLKLDAFAMPFNKKDPYQKKFARYVNRPEIFHSTTWEDYDGK